MSGEKDQVLPYGLQVDRVSLFQVPEVRTDLCGEEGSVRFINLDCERAKFPNSNSSYVLTTLTLKSLTSGVDVACEGVALKARSKRGKCKRTTVCTAHTQVGDVPSRMILDHLRRSVRLERGQALASLMCSSLAGTGGRVPLLDPGMLPRERHQTGSRCLTSTSIVCPRESRVNGIR